MSSVLEIEPLSHAGQLRQARVHEVTEGADVKVELMGTKQLVDCQVLYTGAPGLTLSEGDAVLVWLQDVGRRVGVVLGRTGPYAPGRESVVSPAVFAARPETLVLEAQGAVVLRNGQAKLTLGADGDVEIVCASYTTRCRRLLRLLAPLIKLN